MGKEVFTDKELSGWCEQIAMMMDAGIPLVEGMHMLMEESNNLIEKNVYTVLYEALDNGANLSQALEESLVFPKYMIDMISIGEETGRTEQVLVSLGKFYRREDEISVSVKSAVRYPLIMVAMMVIVLLVLIIKVMPVFNEVFLQLGVTMSGFSLGIMNIGTWFTRYAVVLTCIVVALTLLIIYSKVTVRGGIMRRRFLQNFFLTSRTEEKIALSRLASLIALELASGLELETALRQALRLLDHKRIVNKVQIALSAIGQGEDNESALKEAKLFSGIYIRMISVGYLTGHVDQVMAEIAEHLSEEAGDEVDTRIARIEPTIVALFSIIVGVILLSVMLPLMAIMSSIG